MSTLRQRLTAFCNDDAGRVSVEVAVVIALISIGVLIGLRSVGTAANNSTNTANDLLTGKAYPSSGS